MNIIELVLNDIISSVEKVNADIIPFKYNKLVVSGGAVNGILMLGTLQYLYEMNLLKNIKSQ